MIALRILAVIILILALWIFLTQILFPALNNQRLFPMFRKGDKQVKELDREVTQLNEQVQNLNEARDLKRTKDALQKEKSVLQEALNEDDGPLSRK